MINSSSQKEMWHLPHLETSGVQCFFMSQKSHSLVGRKHLTPGRIDLLEYSSQGIISSQSIIVSMKKGEPSQGFEMLCYNFQTH